METKLATNEFRDEYVKVYQNARRFMVENGNVEQWAGKDFGKEVDEDIQKGVLYETRNDEGALLGVFAFLPSPDPIYRKIDGKWLTDGEYYVLHRVASSFLEHGFLKHAIAFAERISPVLRIDTHKDNIPMQKAVLRLGFSYCGIIWLEDGAERLAYERIKKDHRDF